MQGRRRRRRRRRERRERERARGWSPGSWSSVRGFVAAAEVRVCLL